MPIIQRATKAVTNVWSRLAGGFEEKRERLVRESIDLDAMCASKGWILVKDYLSLRRELAVKALLKGQSEDVEELRSRANEIDCLTDWISGCIEQGKRLRAI